MNASSSFDPRHPLRSLTIPRDALRPPSADNNRLGAGLSLLAHVGLVVALALGVHWHTEEPEGVTAELWSAVPEIAAPRSQPQPEAEEAAPPPPPPAAAPPQPTAAERDAEIAIEKAREEKLEQERREALDRIARERRLKEENERKEAQRKQAEQERAEQEKAEARQRELDKREQARKEQVAAVAREKARQDQLKRMNEQLGGTGEPGSTGTAARDAGPSASYAGRIIRLVRPNIHHPFQLPGNPKAEARVTLLPDGTIARVELSKPSGSAEWDEAVVKGILATGKLPRDENGKLYSPMTIAISQD